jgi:aminopeptidase N
MRLLEIGIAGGGYAGKGASVMSEDSFNEQGLKDSKKGASGSEVLAHEIVHQWWGLGNMFDNGGSNLWSSEGLTVYTTYRMVKEQYGEAYAMEHYVREWQKKVDDYYDNYYVRHPEYLKVLPEKFRTSISNSQSSTRLYCEMPLKLLKAEQLVGGEKKMDIILKKLFTRKIDYSNPNLTYQDFLDACKLTEEDLNLE